MSFADRHKRWLLPTLGAALAGVVWLNLPARVPEEPSTLAPEEPSTLVPEEPSTLVPEEPSTLAPEEPAAAVPDGHAEVVPDTGPMAPDTPEAESAEVPPATGDLGNSAPPAAVDNDTIPLLLAGRLPVTQALRAGPRPPVLHAERWDSLFQPPSPPAPPCAATPPKALDFLLETGTRREAWLDGRAYREGDTLEGGYVLRRINGTGVVVSGPSGELTLPLKHPGTPSPKVPGGSP